MSSRTFFKLYLLPILIVIFGLVVYVIAIILMKNGDIILYRPTYQTNVDVSTKDEEAQIPIVSSNPAVNQPEYEEPKDIKQAESEVFIEPNIPIDTAVDTPVSEPFEPEITDSTKDSMPQNQMPSNTQSDDAKPVYYYAKYRVNVRASPSIESSVLFYANKGEILELVESHNGWLKIRNQSQKEGYVATYLLQQAEEEESESYVVLVRSLNVRAEADSQAVVIGNVTEGTSINVFEISGGWARIQLSNAQQGYVASKFIAKENTD